MGWSRRATKRILVVDDDADWREFVRLSLDDLGYEVVEAGDGDEALKILASEDIDIVLLDLNMPNMSGEQVAARLDEHTGPRIVFLTAADSASVGSALRSGPHYYLPKGASRDQLSLLLDSLHA